MTRHFRQPSSPATQQTRSYLIAGRSKGREWEHGNEDGQRLGYQLTLLRTLKGCSPPPGNSP